MKKYATYDMTYLYHFGEFFIASNRNTKFGQESCSFEQ